MSATIPTPRTSPQDSEIVTDEHHEALTRSWELPSYERPAPPGQPPERARRRTWLVGLISGGLCLAVGFGAGYWANDAVTGSPQPITTVVASAAVPTVPGYSVVHDSRIFEVPQTIHFGRDTRPVVQ